MTFSPWWNVCDFHTGSLTHLLDVRSYLIGFVLPVRLHYVGNWSQRHQTKKHCFLNLLKLRIIFKSHVQTVASFPHVNTFQNHFRVCRIKHKKQSFSLFTHPSLFSTPVWLHDLTPIDKEALARVNDLTQAAVNGVNRQWQGSRVQRHKSVVERSPRLA